MHGRMNIFLVMIAMVSAMIPVRSVSIAAPSDNVDIIVVIDNSGSMHSKVIKDKVAPKDFGNGSDRSGLRYEATKMLVDLLDTDDRMAVVHFSDATHILGEAQTLRRMDDTSRTAIREEIDAIAVNYNKPSTNEKNAYGYINDQNVPPGKTQYTPAFKSVTQLIDRTSVNRQAVIFLTDGAPSDMGTAPAEIKEQMTAQLKMVGVPVFLLMLQNPNEQSQAEIGAVKEAFNKQNQKIIDIASDNDIAHALASVLTNLKPNLYLDVLTGKAGDGNDSSVFKPDFQASQKISDITFVFASKDPKKEMRVQSAGRNPSSGSDSRFTTFRVDTKTGVYVPLEFNVNVAPDKVTSFAFMRSNVRMSLRYPNAGQTNSQILAYPRDIKHVLGAATSGISASALPLITFQATQSCDAVTPVVLPTTYVAQTSGLNTGVVWTEADATNTPLYFNIVFQANPNGGLTLRRCYELQPTDEKLEVNFSKPTTAEPRISDGTLDVAVQLPSTMSVLTDGVTLFYGISNEQMMPNSDMSASETIKVNQSGTQMLRVLVDSQVNERPIALYNAMQVTPQFSCNLTRVTAGSWDLGELTRNDDIDLSVKCEIKGERSPIPIYSMQLLDDQQQQVDVAKYLLLPNPSVNNDTLIWPITLKNVAQLAPGRYTIQFTVDVKGQQIPVSYTFTRPAADIQLSWSDTQPVELGTLKTDQNQLSACMTADIPALALDTTLASDVTVSNLSSGKNVADTRDMRATVTFDTPTCADAYEVQVIVPPTLVAGTYTADLVIESTQPALVKVQPSPVRVQFTTAPLQVQLVFDKSRTIAGDVPTYQVDLTDARELVLAYTVVLTGTERMPWLQSPVYKSMTPVSGTTTTDTTAFAHIHAYWQGPPVLNDSQQYTGKIVLTNVPPKAGTYDIMVGFDDPHITGPKKIALRVVVPDDDVWFCVVLGVIAILLLLFVRWLLKLFTRKPKAPPAARTPTQP